VGGQIQLADDLGPEEADDVGEDGELEAGEELLGDGRAADEVALLQNERLLAGAGQIGSGDQSVVAAADDDGVVGVVDHVRSLSCEGPGSRFRGPGEERSSLAPGPWNLAPFPLWLKERRRHNRRRTELALELDGHFHVHSAAHRRVGGQ